MLLHRLVDLLFLLPVIIVSAAPLATDIIPVNQALTVQTNGVSADVNNLDLQVASALQDLGNSFAAVPVQFQGTTPTSDEEDEQDIVNSYTQVTGAVSTLMTNLIAKEQFYKAEAPIIPLPNIIQLFGAFNGTAVGLSFTALGQSLVASAAYKNQVAVDGQVAVESISSAINVYSSA